MGQNDMCADDVMFYIQSHRLGFEMKRLRLVVSMSSGCELSLWVCVCPQCFPSLKKLQLPSLSKLPFKSIDQKFLDKSKTQLNAFLQVNNPTCMTSPLNILLGDFS